jgi:hypothetical protein
MKTICVHEGEGEVFAVCPNDGSTQRINRRIELLGEFLALYVEYGEACKELSDEQAGETVTYYENLFRQSDPWAFEESEAWWPLVIEQMNAGLLQGEGVAECQRPIDQHEPPIALIADS